MILLTLWFDIRLVPFGKLLDIGKAVDEKGMLCVELMTVHLVEGMSGRVGISEFNKGISMRTHLAQNTTEMWVSCDLPIAFSRLVVPRHRDIIRLDCGTFPCKLFCDFCQKLLKF
jgi:hypothetical protein